MTAVAPRGMEKVLVVDDNETGRYFKAHVLREEGYTVDEAATGAEAIRIAESERPAIVVLDIKLPDISGLDVCRQIKASDPGILVLQTSAALLHKGDRAAGLSGGADSYLVEPLEPEELATTVRALVRLYRAERDLRRANETLEQQVEERTRQLAAMNERLTAEMEERARTEEILRHAQKLDVLGQLTGGIAHDFNNLLMVILGSLEAMKRRCAETPMDVAQFQRPIGLAIQGATRATKLVQQLLAFARRQALDPKTINANKLISDMADILRRALGEKTRIDITLADDLWPARVDRNLLENAILNLAVNARDAMQEGGELRIATRNAHLDEKPDVAAGDYVAIVVTDTGKGMTEEILAHALEPFFTTKDIGHGTGLGRPQVYGFVRQSGGDFTLESKVGKGTTATLYLPRYRGEEPMAVPDGPAEKTIAGGNETVLVVEDDQDVRMHTSMILTELGYNVLQAENGPSALRILESSQDVALLFTDVGLPGGLSGRRLGDEARRRYPRTRILYTTGYGANEIAKEFNGREDIALIRKPFTYAALATKVRQMFGT